MPARPVCPLPECAELQCRGRRATHPGEYLEPDCRPCREPARLPRWPALPTTDRNRGHTSRWGVACGSAVRTAHCAAVHATAGFQGGSFRAADDGRDRRYPSELSFRLLRHCPSTISLRFMVPLPRKRGRKSCPFEVDPIRTFHRQRPARGAGISGPPPFTGEVAAKRTEGACGLALAPGLPPR